MSRAWNMTSRYPLLHVNSVRHRRSWNAKIYREKMLGMNHFDISGSIEICEVDIAGVACIIIVMQNLRENNYKMKTKIKLIRKCKNKRTNNNGGLIIHLRIATFERIRNIQIQALQSFSLLFYQWRLHAFFIFDSNATDVTLFTMTNIMLPKIAV